MNLQRLPAVIKRRLAETTTLPSYEAAVAALADCQNIVECLEWADKAEQIATLAKQSRDRRALETAKRIMIRAKARTGELLLEIPGWLPAKHLGGKEGSLPNPNSRKRIAMRAGLRNHEIHTAVSLAKIDRKMRETLIEASPPASLTHLVRIGERATVERRRATRGEAYQALMQDAHGCLGQFSRWIAKQSAAQMAQGLAHDEADIVRAAVRVSIDWLDELDRNLR